MSRLDNELYYWQGLDVDDLPCHICGQPRWLCAEQQSDLDALDAQERDEENRAEGWERFRNGAE